MSLPATNPTDLPHLSRRLVEQPHNSLQPRNGGGERRSCRGVISDAKGLAAMAGFSRGDADEGFCSGTCLPLCIPPLFGHRFGDIPAPCGSSLFCFGCAALRVTVSLQILFGKTAEKISPEPP
jgi:hypothetical protein